MCTIVVKDIMKGKDYPTSGQDLYNLMRVTFSKGEKVVLDMSEVSMLPSMFLNVSIGRLINENSVDFVKENITFRNIRLSDAQRVREYVQRY